MQQEDKAIIITNLRRSLQDARLQIAELEHKMFEQEQEFGAYKNKLERERLDLQAKVNQFEETNKVCG